MKPKTKLILTVIMGIFALAMIFWIPEFSLVVGIILVLGFGYKKTKNIPIVKRKRRK